ncbi:hypothetical protein EYF80_066609 [Liparis tanakae]|uniref:Uncharacterized protein n=1 Tax=Liparis tanakae TaxID=230148 RepID=A0A4Z2E4K6_9TELE|nr:hypothetical protein EYF80_066609 [Liparis tanakae]
MLRSTRRLQEEKMNRK